MEFYLTEEGQTPKMFDMNATVPNLVAEQGTVEDWIIENRSRELHAFHIHQLHFLLLEYMGRPVNENFVRDTVNVPYYDGRLLGYPSIRIRIDFRDPNIVGTFPYHCHLLEHEDRGMMGTIRVEARSDAQKMTAGKVEGQSTLSPSPASSDSSLSVAFISALSTCCVTVHKTDTYSINIHALLTEPTRQCNFTTICSSG